MFVHVSTCGKHQNRSECVLDTLGDYRNMSCKLEQTMQWWEEGEGGGGGGDKLPLYIQAGDLTGHWCAVCSKVIENVSQRINL